MRRIIRLVLILVIVAPVILARATFDLLRDLAREAYND